MLVLAPLVDNKDKWHPQIFADIGIGEYEPEFYKVGDDYYLRHFLISDKHDNTNGWRVENLSKYVKTFIGRPLIITPGYHHIADVDLNKWLEIQKPYAIGSMTNVVYNPKWSSYDAITQITSNEARSAFEKGYIPKFLSPGIHGSKVRYENGVRVFEEWNGVHSAVVLKPSFRPIEMTQFRDTACTGEKFLCVKELVAVAEEYNIEKLFSYLNNTNEKNPPEDKKLENNPNTSSHVDVLLDKLQKELAEERRLKELEIEKNRTLADNLKKEQETNQSITKERDDFKSKTTSYEAEKAKAELKKSIDVKLKTTKMFYNNTDARSKKVDELVEKNFKVEDLDVIYENMFMTKEEIEKAESAQEQSNVSRAPTKEVGIAEQTHTSLQTRKPNAANVEGALILDDILELRL
jgi:hypothetical protein